MSADLTFTRSGELDVTQIEGNTEAGVEFVDGLFLVAVKVVDSGRVIVPTYDVDEIEREALAAALATEHEVVVSERAS